MKKIFRLFCIATAMAGAAVFTSCKQEANPLSDNTKLWPVAEQQGEKLKFGYMNQNGETVIPAVYDYVASFSNGVGLVGVANASTGDVYSYVDKKGNAKGSFKDAGQHYCGLALVSFDDNIYGYASTSADLKIQPMFRTAKNFSDDYALCYDDAAQSKGYINKNGDWAISAYNLKQYSSLSSFSEGLARIELSDKCGFINKKGELVIDAKFEEASAFSDGLAIYSMNDDSYGFINTKGNIVIAAQYEDAAPFFEDGLAPVCRNDKWGYINKKGEQKINFFYEDAWPFCEGVAMVKVGGKYGFINTKGDFVINPAYSGCGFPGFYMPYFHNGLALMYTYNESDGSLTYSYINKKNEVVRTMTLGGSFSYYTVKAEAAPEVKARMFEQKPSNHYAIGTMTRK